MTRAGTDYAALSRRALREIGDAAARLDPAAADALVEALAGAPRIALYGVGREGLMMKALAMRLFHLGLDAHVVGDMTTPPLGAGDLLLVSAGPGHFSTVEALLRVAKEAGAATACVTAQPEGAVPREADLVLVLPAQTMADDERGADGGGDGGGGPSLLPMGSLYEGVQYVVFELLVLALRDRIGATAQAMRARHTNLE